MISLRFDMEYRLKIPPPDKKLSLEMNKGIFHPKGIEIAIRYETLRSKKRHGDRKYIVKIFVK